MSATCSLCGGVARAVGTQRLLGKYDVGYFSCVCCDLLFTEAPYWLDEAYSHAISQLDTGAVERNRICAQVTTMAALVLGLPASASCLDFGAGHGVFVRMMRDRGLDFHWYDTHAQNLYARGFEDDPARPHALVTAFEVIEHFAQPRKDLEKLFAAQAEAVLIGTVLHHGHHPGWWYYLLESGQHVAFYSAQTMTVIADRFGYDAVAGPEYTLFIRKGHDLGALRLATLRGLIARPAIALALAGLVPDPLRERFGPYRSRLQSDYEQLVTRTKR